MTAGRFKITRCGVDGVQAVSADTTHSFGRHTHDQFGIGVILRGAQKSLSGRGMVEAQAGDIITVNPGEVHDGTPVDGSSRAWRMLYFDPGVLTATARSLTAGSAEGMELSHPALRDPTTSACFLSLFRAMTDPHGGHSEIERQESLLSLLAALIDRPHTARQHGVPTGIEQARARIDDDPSAPLSLDELAAIGGVSRFTLIRAFAKSTGLTPHAYLIQRRLQRARKMIAAGVPLSETAYACGFADQSHMTRLFVNAYGLSPGVYAAAMA